jgi:starvation-inducible outer membrane lipoprotein
LSLVNASKIVIGLLLAAALSGCVVVPQNRRARLADPMMSLNEDALEAHRKQKLYSTREGAAGGDGLAAGGGCGCQ